MAYSEKQAWLGWREVLTEFNLKKTHLYGRLSKMVRTRKMPGESCKWSRSDLERLGRQFTTQPDKDLPFPADAKKILVPRSTKRKREAVPSQYAVKYL